MSDTDEKIDDIHQATSDIHSLIFEDCGPPEPDPTHEEVPDSIWSWFRKLWNEIKATAKGIGKLIDHIIHPIPASFEKVKHVAGGVDNATNDAGKLLMGITVDEHGLSEANTVFSEIETALGGLLRARGLDGKLTNPMTQFITSYSKLSTPVQNVIVGAANAHAPDWKKMPELISETTALVNQHNSGNYADTYSRSTADAMIAFKALSSAISAVGQFWPMTVGLGFLGGVSIGVEGEAEIGVNFVAVGKMILVIKVVADIVYEILNDLVKSEPDPDN